jgi:hypothetical protein
MYQQNNNNENKRYNCSCGAAFVTLKELINIITTTTIRSLVGIRKSISSTPAANPSFSSLYSLIT